MRNSGWLSLSSDFQVTGLPRSLSLCTRACIQKFDKILSRHGVVPRPSPLRLRPLTTEEETSLKKIKKATYSPISLMHIHSSDNSLSSILPELVAKVAEQAPSLVVIRSPILIRHPPAYSTSLPFPPHQPLKLGVLPLSLGLKMPGQAIPTLSSLDGLSTTTYPCRCL